MEQLRDIKDLNQISIWPLAYGWWLVIAIVLIIAICLLYLFLKKRSYRNSWQYIAMTRLQELRAQINEPSVIGDLFELLKKVSLTKYNRLECAHLTGYDWLIWLKNNDKNKFDWPKYAKNLVKLQYASMQEIEQKMDQTIKDELNNIFDAISNIIKN